MSQRRSFFQESSFNPTLQGGFEALSVSSLEPRRGPAPPTQDPLPFSSLCVLTHRSVLETLSAYLTRGK